MKTDFELENSHGKKTRTFARIVGRKSKNEKTFVSIEQDASDMNMLYMPEDQLERFAVNILKALGSNKLGSPRGTGKRYII